MQTISQSAPKGGSVSVQQVEQVIAQACPVESYRGKRVLLVVPDGTRTAPVGLMFKTLHRQLSGVTKALDVLIAVWGIYPKYLLNHNRYQHKPRGAS